MKSSPGYRRARPIHFWAGLLRQVDMTIFRGICYVGVKPFRTRLDLGSEGPAQHGPLNVSLNDSHSVLRSVARPAVRVAASDLGISIGRWLRSAPQYDIAGSTV